MARHVGKYSNEEERTHRPFGGTQSIVDGAYVSTNILNKISKNSVGGDMGAWLRDASSLRKERDAEGILLEFGIRVRNTEDEMVPTVELESCYQQSCCAIFISSVNPLSSNLVPSFAATHSALPDST